FFESSGADPVRLYRTIIEDVIENSIEFFVEEGVEKTVLRDLKKLWELKLLQSNAVGSFPVDNQLLLLKAHVHFLQIPCSNNTENLSFDSTEQMPDPNHNYKKVVVIQSDGRLAMYGRNQQVIQLGHLTISSAGPALGLPACLDVAPGCISNSPDKVLERERCNFASGVSPCLCVPPQRELASLQRSASQLAVLEELELAVTGCVSAHKNIGLMSRLEHTRFKHVKTVMLVRSSSAMSTLTRGRLFFGSEKARRDADELPLLLQLDGAEDSSEEPEGHDLSSTTTTSSDDSDGVDDMDAKFLEEELVVEEDPLNSGDDVSEQDNSEMFDVDNVVVCQYDKIHRSKNKWKFHFKDGIMNLDGLDYFFSKLAGDAEW
uniref:General transcription factor IIA, 1-like n=1 Tax=Petromyzon marinus TaxID=7757 RepID=S4R6Q6_PETMA